MAQENADPGVQNQGEEKPQVLLDASEYSRIWVDVSAPISFDDVIGWSLNAHRSVIGWSLNAHRNALACHVRVVLAPQFRSDGEDMDFRRAGDHRQDSKLLKGSLDRTKCNSALWEAGHSSLEKAHPSRTLWGARSEQQLGSNKAVCQDLGDEIWRLQGPSNIRSMNSKHLRGKRVSTTHQSGLMLVRDLLKHAQNYSPSLQIETNLWKKLNTLPSENHFSLENKESSVAVGIDLKMDAKKLDGKMTSEKLDYSSDCNLNKHKETMPKDHMFQPHDTFNQQKCKETTKRASAFVILAAVCIWFLLQTWSQALHKFSVPTLIHVQPLHKERGPVSIGVPLIGLFGFMAFVWAAAMMILGAQFTRLHSAVLIFLAIFMHVRPSTYQYSEYFS